MHIAGRRAQGAATNSERPLQYLDSGEGGGRVCRMAPIAPKCAGQMSGQPPLIDLQRGLLSQTNFAVYHHSKREGVAAKLCTCDPP